MKIFNFLNFGFLCGLSTVEETFYYTHAHSPSIFGYDNFLEKEQNIISELKKYNFAYTTTNENGELSLKISPINLSAALETVNCCNGTNLKFSDENLDI